MEPKLSILIATLGHRYNLLQSLLDSLLPQVDKTGGQIEVIIYRNNGELAIGQYRQALLEEAKGEYVCFVDDDDGLPDFYCEKILQNLGEDYVGFKVKLSNDGIQRNPVYHSIKYDRWSQDDTGYYRGVTHLNPIRRELALKGRFHANGSGEDENWAKEVQPFVKTENFINEFMYYYYHSSKDSYFSSRQSIHKIFVPPLSAKSKYFRYHPLSKV